MKGTATAGLLLLSLGLCLVSSNANEVRVYGGTLFDFNQDMTKQLITLQKNKEEIEKTLNRKWISRPEKSFYSKELGNVLRDIKRIEETGRVTYKEYLKMKAEQEGHYEKEMGKLRTKLEKAKEQELHDDIQHYQEKLDALIKEREQVKKLYNEHVQASKQIQDEMKEEQAQLEKEKEEVKQILNSAKSRHARALDVLSSTTNEVYRPVRVPQLETINQLKQDMRTFIVMKDRKLQLEGLQLTKTKLEALLPVLHEKGKFYEGTDRSDLEVALSVMETNTAQLREEQNSQRKELLEKLKKKGLTDYSDDDIATLQKINEELEATDSFAQEVAQRSAYVNALLEVYDLIKECSDAIRDSKSGVLAKLLAFAF